MTIGFKSIHGARWKGLTGLDGRTAPLKYWKRIFPSFPFMIYSSFFPFFIQLDTKVITTVQNLRIGGLSAVGFEEIDWVCGRNLPA